LDEGDRWLGVEWLDGKGKLCVLFSFEPMEWKVPKGVRVVELIENEHLKADRGLRQDKEVACIPHQAGLLGKRAICVLSRFTIGVQARVEGERECEKCSF